MSEVKSAVQGAAKAGGTAVPPPDVLGNARAVLWIYRGCLYPMLALVFWQGGPFVRLAALLAVLFGLLADRAGAVRHMLHLLALPIALALATWIAPAAAPALAARAGMTVPVATLAVGAAVVLLGVLLTGLVARRLTRRARQSPVLYFLNHGAGGVLGAAEGVLVAALLFCTLSMFGPTFGLYADGLKGKRADVAQIFDTLSRWTTAMRTDPAGAWVAERNPLERMPAVVTTAAAAEISADPAAFWELGEDPDIQDMLADPVLRKHIDAWNDDATVRRAIEERDLGALLRHPRLNAALHDGELMNKLVKVWPMVQTRLSMTQLAHAEQAVRALGPDARARYERAVQRARSLGLEPPPLP